MVPTYIPFLDLAAEGLTHWSDLGIDAVLIAFGVLSIIIYIFRIFRVKDGVG